jgi:uncharacterized membrane protein YhaH (DUF805 family)
MFKSYYLSLQGRCDRQQYWLFGVLPYVILWAVLLGLARGLPFDRYALYLLLLLALWPLVTMQVKRYHDLDMSGWFALLLLLPFLGKVMAVVIGILPGKPGDNRYGPDLQGRPTQTVEPQQLGQTTVLTLFLLGFFAYLAFANVTGFEDFGLLASNEERWMLWRWLLVTAWLFIAVVIYMARGQKAYLMSVLMSLGLGFALSLFLLFMAFITEETRFAVLGSALTYAFIAGMLCMTFKNLLAAIIGAVLFFAAQILVDAVVLGIAANVRIH